MMVPGVWRIALNTLLAKYRKQNRGRSSGARSTRLESSPFLKSLPDEAFTKSVEPWLGVTEHTAEHYGLLIAYYRANGLVPPASRPKK